MQDYIRRTTGRVQHKAEGRALLHACDRIPCRRHRRSLKREVTARVHLLFCTFGHLLLLGKHHGVVLSLSSRPHGTKCTMGQYVQVGVCLLELRYGQGRLPPSFQNSTHIISIDVTVTF